MMAEVIVNEKITFKIEVYKDMEALISIDCSGYSDDIFDIINVLEKIGWSYYDKEGYIEYLPLGDNDCYDWQKGKLDSAEFNDLISKKVTQKERIGISLFYQYGNEGTSMIATGTNDILFCLDINRRILRDDITDLSWYLDNIINKLRDAGVEILSLEIEEYVD